MSLFAHADGSVTNYSYNADGIRTGKQYLDAGGGELGTVKYTLDGNKIVAEQRGNTMLYYLYDDNGAVMGIGYGDNTYTFAKNIQGDVIGIYNGSTLVAKYQYNAYGVITAITDANGNDVSGNASHIANINPFRYRGYYYDTETGFYYLQSRYYDPVVGRFLNADAFVSTGQGILGNNMFAYCGNNPVIYADYKGFSVASVLDETIRMSAVSAGWGGVSAALGGLSPVGGIVGTIIVVAFLSSNGISYNSSFDDNDIVSGECRSVSKTDYEYYPDYYGVYTAPVSRVASKAIAKEEEKDVALSYTPPKSGTAYYHSTTPEAARIIMNTGIMIGSGWEGGHVYAWKMKPSRYAIRNSGARFGVIISFETNVPFIDDIGISDPGVRKYGPVVTLIPMPVKVSNVQIVG